jgi:hypothetical protein
LEDFLISSTLSVDEQPNDGWGATFPVKGREIEATVLFSDITAFSRRTLDLSPTETLIFVTWFFSWVTPRPSASLPLVSQFDDTPSIRIRDLELQLLKYQHPNALKDSRDPFLHGPLASASRG